MLTIEYILLVAIFCMWSFILFSLGRVIESQEANQRLEDETNKLRETEEKELRELEGR